eukprot:TRINITY_DN911_c0_g1_i1.p1 TRINITY_DN911_c0_g1~~TRINITY_DN911_c0_g1_i1.p1  ORF type:complete len:347 (+),score=64.98 TRINITY_DN911_c0_g1_i1:35-1075(+)
MEGGREEKEPQGGGPAPGEGEEGVLSKRIDVLGNMHRVHDEEVKALSTEVRQLRERCKEMMADMKRESCKIQEESGKLLSEVTAMKGSANAPGDELLEEFKSIKDDVKSVTEAHDKVIQLGNDWKAQRGTLVADIKRLKGTQKLQSKCDTQKLQESEAAANAARSSELEAIREEISVTSQNHLAHLKDSTQRSEEVTKRLGDLQDKVAKLQLTVDQLDSLVATLLQDSTWEVAQSVDDLQDKVERLQSMGDQLDSQVATLQDSTRRSEEVTNDLQDKVAKLKSTGDQLDSLVTTLQNSTRRSEETMKRLQDSVEDLNKRLVRLNYDLNTHMKNCNSEAWCHACSIL